MTPEQIEIALTHLATKADVSALEATMHKELHLLTWRFITLLVSALVAQTGIILGAMYFMLTHLKVP